MNKSGDGRRVQRVEKEVQQAIAAFVLRDLQGELPGFVTITGVRMTADLRNARVAVSIIVPDQTGSAPAAEAERKARAEAVDILQSWAPEIQDHLNAELAMRFCPRLTFVPDDTTERVLHVESVLRDLSAKSAEKKPKGDA